MIREALYYKTLDTLKEAYFKDELEHGNGCGCAVGNIVKKAFEERGFKNKHNGGWTWLFQTSRSSPSGLTQNWNLGYDTLLEWEIQKDNIIKDLLLTGYTVNELARIEFAFESAPMGESNDEWMFNGLMAVVEVLDQIHQNDDKVITTNSKNKFIKHGHTQC